MISAARTSPARFFLALLDRSGEFFPDRFAHAGNRQQMKRLLDRVPIFLGNQNGIGARACNEGGFVSSRRLIEETVQVLTSLTGVHAVHSVSVRIFLRFGDDR